jgi:hypothetical protein
MRKRLIACMGPSWIMPMNNKADEKVDAVFRKHTNELILLIVGTVGLGVIINHFWH